MTSSKNTKTTLLAGGCFWCIEAAVRNIPGVTEVFSGYAGGSAEEANYEAVASRKTKHREVVEVTYDPDQTSFADLIRHFFTLIDPTDPDGQFADRGYDYTTAVYYASPEEKQELEDIIAELDASGTYDAPIVTSIEPIVPFYPAEEYHQQYAEKNPLHYALYYRGSGRKRYIDDMKKKQG